MGGATRGAGSGGSRDGHDYFSNADELGQAGGNLDNEAVVTVLPVVGKDEDGSPCLHIPKEAGYIQSIEPLQRVANVAKSK